MRHELRINEPRPDIVRALTRIYCTGCGWNRYVNVSAKEKSTIQNSWLEHLAEWVPHDDELADLIQDLL